MLPLNYGLTPYGSVSRQIGLTEEYWGKKLLWSDTHCKIPKAGKTMQYGMLEKGGSFSKTACCPNTAYYISFLFNLQIVFRRAMHAKGFRREK